MSNPERLPAGISIRAGKYFARVKINGEEQSRSFSHAADAIAWRDMRLGKAHRRPSGGPPLRSYANEILRMMERGAMLNGQGMPYAPSVIRRYRSWLERVWFPALGTHRVDAIRRGDIQRILRELGVAHAGSTVRDALKPMQVIYRELIQDEVLTVNPTLRLRLPAKSSRKQRINDPNDPLAVVGVKEAKQRLALLSGRERAFWALAFYAGLRAGEIRGLRWEDVDLKRGQIHVRRQIVTNEHEAKLPKGGKMRSVPMFEDLRKELAVWALEQDKGADGLVVSTNRTPYTYSDVVDRTRKIWDAAGLRHITPHEARHTFVSMLAAAGAPADEAREWSGHSAEEMRLLYTHLMPDATERTRKAVERYMRGHD